MAEGYETYEPVDLGRAFDRKMDQRAQARDLGLHEHATRLQIEAALRERTQQE